MSGAAVRSVSGTGGPDTTPDTRRRFTAFLLIALTSVATVSIMLPVFRDSLIAYYRLSNTGFGVLANIGSLAGAGGALLSGLLTDRRGAWPVFRVSLAGCAAGYAWGAVPAGAGAMIGALALLNFFYYAMAVSAQAALVALFPEARRRVITVYLAGAALMGMALPLIGEWQLTSVAAGWMSFGQSLHGLFAVAALILAAGLVWSGRLAAAPIPAATPSAAAGRGGTVSGLGWLVAFAALHCGHDNMVYTWLPLVLAGPSFASHAILPGLVLALFSLGYLLSRLALGAMPERKWRRRLLVAPGLLGGAVLLAGLLSRSPMGLALGYVLGGLCWSVEYPMAISAMAGDRRFGFAMGIVNVAGGAFCFIGPAALGRAADALVSAGVPERAWLVLLAPAAGFLGNGLLGAFWVRRHGRPLDAAPPLSS